MILHSHNSMSIPSSLDTVNFLTDNGLVYAKPNSYYLGDTTVTSNHKSQGHSRVVDLLIHAKYTDFSLPRFPTPSECYTHVCLDNNGQTISASAAHTK
jgi:hypothetical protein